MPTAPYPVGHYPLAVTLVGYEFKRERFMQLHRAAVGYPLHRFTYVGTPALNEGALKVGAGCCAAAAVCR